MTLWWIGNAVLLLVIVPVVVILLRGVLNAAKATSGAVDALRPVAEAASKDLDAVELLNTTQGRSARRSPWSRTTVVRSTRSSRTPEMEAAAVVTLIAVVLVILALVVYLVAVILELRRITAGLDTVIESVGGIVTKSKPVNGVVEAINKDLSAGTDFEGLLDKKAGRTTPRDWSSRCSPAPAPPCSSGRAGPVR